MNNEKTSAKNQSMGGSADQADKREQSENNEVKKEENENLQEDQTETLSDSFGKFNSAKDLLNAYNNLEAEFTKRSQALKRLQKEMGELKAEQAEKQGLANEEIATAAQDETGSVSVGQALENVSDESEEEERIAKEVSDFLSNNPEASKFAEAIAQKTSTRGEVESGFLERAYIEVLQDALAVEKSKVTDDFIYNKASESQAVREKIIRDYLSGVISSKGAVLLGYDNRDNQSVVMPPKKPLSIYEAGLMAVEVLRKK